MSAERRRAFGYLYAAVALLVVQVAARLLWPFWADFFGGWWLFMFGFWFHYGKYRAMSAQPTGVAAQEQDRTEEQG